MPLCLLHSTKPTPLERSETDQSILPDENPPEEDVIQ
jgi:hypothetical protein